MSEERRRGRGSETANRSHDPTGEQGPTSGRAAARGGSSEPEAQARDIVYRLLATRARSTAEVRNALLRKGIEADLAERTVTKFVDAGLVDDAEFAQAWVQSRHHHRGLGRRALRHELRNKGLDEQLVTAALADVDSDSEVDRARELVQRKLRSIRALDHPTKTRRLVGMLARKGYGESLAYRVVQEEIERDAAETD